MQIICTLMCPIMQYKIHQPMIVWLIDSVVV